MKKLFTTILLTLAVSIMAFAAEPPEGSFSWGVQVPLQMDYLSSETLSVTSATISQYTVTYELVDTSMARYIDINGNVVTVLNHYAGDSELTQGRIYIKAVISGMTGYEDTELLTYIRTYKIYPMLRWNCTLGDMPCGSSVALSAIHGNTDRPSMNVTYTASDNVSSPTQSVRINQNLGIMTAVRCGTDIYVTASIDSSENYKATSITYFSNDSIVRFNVVKGNRIISWNRNDFSGINNFSADIPLTLIYLDNDDPVTVVSDNPLIAEVLPGNILRIHKEGNVRLTATVDSTDNYYTAVSDTVINIPAVTPTISWDENVISNMDEYKRITSTTCGFSMKVWVNSNYGDTTNYIFTIPESEQHIAKVVNDTSLCCYSEGTIHLSAVARAAGLASQTVTHDINIYTGELDFVSQGNWNDLNCWSRSDLASHPEDYHVNIVSHCTVKNGSNVQCKGLKIYANGSLTIEPEARLQVDNTVENFGSETSLVLMTDQDRSAQLVMGSGNPLATLQMFMRHSIHGKDTVWCSHGIALDKGYLRSTTGKLRVKNWNNGWRTRTGQKIQLDAFEGYLVTDTLPNTYTVDGRIMAGDKTFDLHRSVSGDYKGRNFIANSYTAPINISSLEFSEMNSELFEYINGQYRTLPRFTAYTMGHGKWLTGRSLFADALNDDSRITVDYKKAVITDDNASLYNMLRLSVTGQSGYSDTLVLMDADFCTEDYDDGYDGTKWAGDTCMPQLYANTSWGKAFLNVESSIVSQRIGFKAAREGEFYTIRFHTEGLDSTYSSLYLFDTRTQEFTDIIAGKSYTFTGTTLGENDRFTIMRDKVVPEKDKYGRCIMILGDKVLLVGFENSDMPVRVITMDGKVVCEYNTQDGPWLQLPQLAPGFYFINAERCSTKFFR